MCGSPNCIFYRHILSHNFLYKQKRISQIHHQCGVVRMYFWLPSVPARLQNLSIDSLNACNAPKQISIFEHVRYLISPE